MELAISPSGPFCGQRAARPYAFEKDRDLRETVAMIGRDYSLRTERALKNANKIRFLDLQQGDFWCAIPDDDALLYLRQERVLRGDLRYCGAVKIGLEIFGEWHGLRNARPDAIRPGFWQIDQRTAAALRQLRQMQKAEILIVGGRFVTIDKGSSAMDVHRKMLGGEFAAHSIAVTAVLHTHRHLLAGNDRRDILFLGERCGMTPRAHLEEVPVLRRSEEELRLDTLKEHEPSEKVDALVLFLPNERLRPYLA